MIFSQISFFFILKTAMKIFFLGKIQNFDKFRFFFTRDKELDKFQNFDRFEDFIT